MNVPLPPVGYKFLKGRDCLMSIPSAQYVAWQRADTQERFVELNKYLLQRGAPGRPAVGAKTSI